MPFQPVVTLTKVPRDNASFVLTDATPTGSDGYGDTNAPANQAALTSFFGMWQPYGGIPSPATGYSGTLATTLTFAAAIRDGVNTYIALYGLQKTFTTFTVSSDGKTITTTDPDVAALMDSVDYISIDGVAFPVAVLSVSGGTITLAGSVPPNISGTTLYVYYAAQVQAMTINNGEALCVNGISLLPVESDSCEQTDQIIHNILLKLGAEIAFNCGNLSKANEAALLLGGSAPLITSNCASCT